jgi:hypothetical protein
VRGHGRLEAGDVGPGACLGKRWCVRAPAQVRVPLPLRYHASASIVLARADFFIVSPIVELGKTLVSFGVGISGGATVVAFVTRNVSIPPRPKAMGAPPARLSSAGTHPGQEAVRVMPFPV